MKTWRSKVLLAIAVGVLGVVSQAQGKITLYDGDAGELWVTGFARIPS